MIHLKLFENFKEQINFDLLLEFEYYFRHTPKDGTKKFIDKFGISDFDEKEYRMQSQNLFENFTKYKFDNFYKKYKSGELNLLIEYEYLVRKAFTTSDKAKLDKFLEDNKISKKGLRDLDSLTLDLFEPFYTNQDFYKAYEAYKKRNIKPIIKMPWHK